MSKKKKKVKKNKRKPLKIILVIVVIVILMAIAVGFIAKQTTKPTKDKGGITAMEARDIAVALFEDSEERVLLIRVGAFQLQNTGKAEAWVLIFLEGKMIEHAVTVFESGKHEIRTVEQQDPIGGEWGIQNWTLDSDEIAKIIWEKEDDFFTDDKYPTIDHMDFRAHYQNYTICSVLMDQWGVLSDRTYSAQIYAGNGTIRSSSYFKRYTWPISEVPGFGPTDWRGEGE